MTGYGHHYEITVDALYELVASDKKRNNHDQSTRTYIFLLILFFGFDAQASSMAPWNASRTTLRASSKGTLAAAHNLAAACKT